MASSPSKLLLLVLPSLLSFVLIPSPALSQTTCTTQKFNNLYANCLDLPVLSSYLHYTYDAANATLSIAFIAAPSKSNGWISWAINPAATGMVGSQALVAYKDGSVAVVKTYNISSYSSVVQSPLSFEVWDTSAEADSSTGLITMFAKVKVPADLAAKSSFNQVWQVGPSVNSATGGLTAHDFASANLASKGTLDLAGGGLTPSTGGGGDSRTKKKNIHGVLNAVSWGILFPLGVIIARYVKTFESAGDAWFYLHVACQIAGYAVGAAGWATGLKLGSESHGIIWHTHRNIGITLFTLATLQLFALFLRPQKDHKFRLYWNLYHWSVGYTVIVLGILNIFKGFDILHPEKKWKTAYTIVIIALGGVSALMELITWIIVIRRKSMTNKSTKPYDGYNGHQQDGSGA